MKSPGLPPLLEKNRSIATLTLRRPEMANCLDPSDLEQIILHLEEINRDQEIRVLLIQAEGEYFCSGFNVKSIDGSATQRKVSFEDMVNAVEACRAITICAIQGSAFGGATDLILACDFRLGVEKATFSVPAANLGIHFYRSGIERYVTRLGMDTAKRVLIGCEKLNGQQMYTLGILNWIFESREDMQSEALKLGQRISQMAPLSILPMKKHINALARGSLDEQAIERDILLASNSEDLKEGVRALKEKRTPEFKGY